MIAVDTNIVVRLIVADDEAQVARAVALGQRETLYVSYGVLIEAEWVLRSRYAYGRRAIVAAFRNLPELVGMRFEDDGDVAWALDRFEQGGELADYIHIAAARDVGRWATFEEKLVRRAGDSPPAVVLVL